VLDEAFASLSHLWGDFGQPNRRLHSFNLAEERSEAAEFVVAPVLKESFRLGRHQPVIGVREFPPLIHLIAKIVDN
jgi:hypothetical protein